MQPRHRPERSRAVDAVADLEPAAVAPAERPPVHRPPRQHPVPVVPRRQVEAVAARRPRDAAGPATAAHPEGAPQLHLVAAVDLHRVVGARRPAVRAQGAGFVRRDAADDHHPRAPQRQLEREQVGMAVPRLVIGAGGAGVADDVVTLCGTRPVVPAVGKGEDARARRRRARRAREPARGGLHVQRAVVEQRDAAVGMGQGGEGPGRRSDMRPRQRFEVRHSGGAQEQQAVEDAALVHRRPLDVSAVGEHLPAQLARQQLPPPAEPGAGRPVVEAAPRQGQGEGVLQQVVAQEMPLQVPRQMLRLLVDAPPQRRPERVVGQGAGSMAAEEACAPGRDPQRGRIRLPPDPVRPAGMARDPVHRRLPGALEGQRPQELVVVQVVAPEAGRTAAIPVGDARNLRKSTGRRRPAPCDRGRSGRPLPAIEPDLRRLPTNASPDAPEATDARQRAHLGLAPRAIPSRAPLTGTPPRRSTDL